MALKVLWKKRPLNKINDILKYQEVECGEVVTSAFVIKVYNFTDNIQYFPELGAIQNHEHQIRGFVIVKQVTIFLKSL